MHSAQRLFALTLALAALPSPAAAQASSDADLFYAVRSDAVIYQVSDTTRPYVSLRLREPVYREEVQGDWARVRTQDGARGLVRQRDISNVWVRVSKKHQTLFMYEGTELTHRLPADLGYNFFSDKVKRGAADDPDHWRTPDGVFHVVMKNARSKYHKAFVINYPNREDAERGLRDSLITQSQYEAIVEADRVFRMPPMSTPLGGWIEIHGDGTGRRANWTQGCIAIENHRIDQLWDLIHVGTPVVIEP